MISEIGQFKPLNILKNHIEKCAANNSYAAKSLLFTTVGLDIYSNMVDYFQLNKSKEIKKDDKQYLKDYKLVNAFVSATADTVVGLTIISDKSQKLIIRGISKFQKDFTKTLNKGIRENIMKISSLLGAVIFTKRILVPLIVTPLTSLFKKKINTLDENKNETLKFSYREHFDDAENIFKKYNNMQSKQNFSHN